jgi:hypothetical protein
MASTCFVRLRTVIRVLLHRNDSNARKLSLRVFLVNRFLLSSSAVAFHAVNARN